jgi:putative ABC transport system permease protein
MLKNYFKISFRNLRRHKSFSIINIAGLSISLALVILIASYAQFEIGINKFHKNYERIFKVAKGNSPAPLVGIIKSNLPEIEKAARIENFRTKSVAMKYGNKLLEVKDIIFSDPDFFDIFTFPAIEGNPQKALNEPMTLVLTKNQASRIFGDEDPLNKIVKMDNTFDLTVKAVINNIPQNSSMQFSGVVSFISIKKMIRGKNFDPFNWGNFNYETYILFPKNANKAELENKIQQVLKNNIPPDRKDVNTELYSFKDIYYNQELSGLNKHGSSDKNFALISIAVLILLIAIINFINLSTARVSTRNKETGVRKTLGASRSNLITQFLSESFSISIISMIAAVLIALLLVELFDDLININLSLFAGSILLKGAVFLISAVLLGILSGIYPAFYLTSFRPDTILKGNIYHGQGKVFLRRALIIFQFSITVVLIISTITIYKQMEFVRNKPLGFQKENIIYFPVNREIYSKKDVFKTKILQHSSVIDFSYSASVPGLMGMTWGMDLKYEGKESQVWFHSVPTSSNFINLMGMKMLKGRDFIPNDSNDIGNVIINEAFANKFGLKKPFEARLTGMGEGKGNIVGIVKDFNFEPLFSEVNPLAFFYFPRQIGYGVIKLNSSNYQDIKSVINNFKSVWKELSPDFPTDYNFLDDGLNWYYREEVRFENTFFYFSLFAIFIACMGLFGLTAYTIEQRTKEITIRKILGASVPSITVLLSKQFILLVLISNIVAWPAAYYITNNWLKDFAYRINTNLWFFILSALIALFIALMTVSSHAIKAAAAKPVENLRYE